MKNITKYILSILLIICAKDVLAQNLSLVKDINTSAVNNSFPHYLTAFNSKIYFVAGNGIAHKIYSTDGTSAGTQLIGPSTGNGIVYYLTAYNNKLFFTYDDGISGLELWVSDGTASGTVLLKDIWPGQNSSLPSYFTICNGLLFFQASTAARSEGLWVTDGTVAGTQMLGNQYSNPFGSPNQFIVFNNKIYFQGNAGSGYGMWESNGTTAGTQLVKSGNFVSSGGNYTVCNNKFYFAGSDAINGTELWQSDGTIAGTTMLKDINPGIQSSSPEKFLCSKNKIYFSSDNGINGKELWVSDGTGVGTLLVKDLFAGSSNSLIQNIIEFNSEVLFFGYNGSARELYKTNGTSIGTQMVKTFTGISSIPYVYEFKSKLYFLAGVDGGSFSTYQSDGTTNGTVEISPKVQTLNYADLNFLGLNTELFLPAIFDTQGLELGKLSFPTTGISVKNNLKNEFKLFPNPAKDMITIQKSISLESSKHTYYIYNSTGQIVMNGIYEKSENYKTIDISALSQDIYTLKIINDANSESIKFVKVK